MLERGEGEVRSYVSLLCCGEVRERGSYESLLCWREVRVREGVMYL